MTHNFDVVMQEHRERGGESGLGQTYFLQN